MIPTAVIFIGIQATGKSTFHAERFAKTHVHISLDVLRTRYRERQSLDHCFSNGQSFVMDNTNPTRADRARIIGQARLFGFRTEGYYFQSRIEEALARNSLRANPIPELGLRGTFARLELPSLEEGFDELSYVRMNGSGGFTVEAWNHEV
jgi:predicted kinase